MSRLSRLLLIVVIAELSIAAFIAVRRTVAVLPPPLNLERLDRRTAAEIRELQAGVAPDDPAGWEKLGLACLSFGYFPEAEACLARAAAIGTPSHELLLCWGLCLDRQGKLDEAIIRFDQAATLVNGKRQNVCFYHIARCALRKADVEQARTALTAAGDFELARYELAKLLARTGHADEAAAILDVMLASHPLELKLILLRARVATALGDAGAVRRCRDLRERARERLFTDSTVEYIGLLRAMRGLPHLRAQSAELEHAGKYAAAADQLSNAQKLEWDLATARRLVRFDVVLKRYDEAATVLDEMTERFGTSPEFLEQQGDLAFLQLRADDAEELWQRAVRMRPNARLHRQLADAADRRGAVDVARINRARMEHWLGVGDYRENRDVEAIKHFRSSLELDPQQADAWLYLGELQRVAGQTEEAAAAYRRCLELRPHSGRAMDQLAELSGGSPAVP